MEDVKIRIVASNEDVNTAKLEKQQRLTRAQIRTTEASRVSQGRKTRAQLKRTAERHSQLSRIMRKRKVAKRKKFVVKTKSRVLQGASRSLYSGLDPEAFR